MPREETGGWEASTRVVVWGAATALAARALAEDAGIAARIVTA